jgi:hypothetical protein
VGIDFARRLAADTRGKAEAAIRQPMRPAPAAPQAKPAGKGEIASGAASIVNGWIKESGEKPKVIGHRTPIAI